MDNDHTDIWTIFLVTIIRRRQSCTPETQPNDVKAWFCWVSDIQLETLEKSDLLSAETVKATYG